MRTVYKFQLPLEFSAYRSYPLPVDHKVVLVGDQGGVLTLWIEYDPGMPCTDHEFQVIGTGHNIPKGAVHVGSAIVGPFVWHVYKLPR